VAFKREFTSFSLDNFQNFSSGPKYVVASYTQYEERRAEHVSMSVCVCVCVSAAIEGRMLSVVTSNDSHWTTINVALANVIHETTHFVDLLTSVPRDPAFQSHGVRRSTARELVLPLRTPSVCQARRGEGLFVFVGRIRLKRTLHVQCAARLDEFRSVWFSAVQRQMQPCHLHVT